MSQWEGSREVGLAPHQTSGQVGGSYVVRPAGSDTSTVYKPGVSSTSIMIEGGATAGRKGVGAGRATSVQRDRYGNVLSIRQTSPTGQTLFERRVQPGGGFVEEGLPFGIQERYAEIQKQREEMPLYRRQAEYRIGMDAKRRQYGQSPSFQLPIFEREQQRFQLPKKTFTILEGRTSQEYYKTYPYIPKEGTPRISEPLQSFGKNIFGQEQGVPQSGKTYRKDWLGGYTEVSPIKAKVTSKAHFEAIKTSDTYAPYFVPFGTFTTTSMLRGASLNIRYPTINIKGAIKKTGKSAWANSLEMLKDTSATTGRKAATAERTKPFNIPTREDLFGKPKSVYYERSQGAAAKKTSETIGGYARNWETQFEYELRMQQAKPKETRGISWWEAYESKQTGRRMLESWAMRKYKGLPSLKNLRPTKYPLAVYKTKPVVYEVNKFELSSSFRNALNPVSKVKYRPVYGLGIISTISTHTGAKAKTKLSPVTTPIFKTPTIVKQKLITIQAPKYEFDVFNINKTKTSLRYTPKQTYKPIEIQPPRPIIKQPPPYIPKFPKIYMPTFEAPNMYAGKPKKQFITSKTIKTQMLTLRDLLGRR